MKVRSITMPPVVHAVGRVKGRVVMITAPGFNKPGVCNMALMASLSVAPTGSLHDLSPSSWNLKLLMKLTHGLS